MIGSLFITISRISDISSRFSTKCPPQAKILKHFGQKLAGDPRETSLEIGQGSLFWKPGDLKGTYLVVRGTLGDLAT